jgi:xanthine dehydrogenase accessory factor
MDDQLCVIRGGGDLATGVAWRLTRAGVPVVVTELPNPLTVRRTVALSSAVTEGTVDIEGMIGQLAPTMTEAIDLARASAGRVVGVVVAPELRGRDREVEIDVVVDARLAKHNIDTSIDDAPLVIGLGPGFTAGVDCDAVVETMRGPHLGRVLWSGSAEPNTGTPGIIEGRGAERVIRSQVGGEIRWVRSIGDVVDDHEMLGTVGEVPVLSPFAGVIRGLILDGSPVPAGLKIGDVDPRLDVSACHEISDKALAIGGGVVEAVLWWSHRSH